MNDAFLYPGDPGIALDPVAMRNSSAFPGNAIGSTAIPDLLDPSQSVPVGGANGSPSLWSDWYDKAKSVVLWPGHAVASAYDVVTSTPKNVVDWVKKEEEAVVASATGIGSNIWTAGKYILAVIALLAVVYLVAVFYPALKGKK